MLNRAYNLKRTAGKKAYEGVAVCDEWLSGDVFIDWCEKQVGFSDPLFQLDKDILVKWNKIYSPKTCVFVPREINLAITRSDSSRGEFPIGVSWSHKSEKFGAYLSEFGKLRYLGMFPTPEEAFYTYKSAKEKYLKVLADKYKDVIDRRCYEALCAYQVEITD
jgi:hypothetical protein